MSFFCLSLGNFRDGPCIVFLSRRALIGFPFFPRLRAALSPSFVFFFQMMEEVKRQFHDFWRLVFQLFPLPLILEQDLKLCVPTEYTLRFSFFRYFSPSGSVACCLCGTSTGLSLASVRSIRFKVLGLSRGSRAVLKKQYSIRTINQYSGAWLRFSAYMRKKGLP